VQDASDSALADQHDTNTAVSWKETLNMNRINNGQQRKPIVKKSLINSSCEGEFNCHICGASLKGRQTLNDHIRGTHFSMYSCACPYCGKSFKWRSGLSNHKLTCAASPRMLAAKGLVDDGGSLGVQTWLEVSQPEHCDGDATSLEMLT